MKQGAIPRRLRKEPLIEAIWQGFFEHSAEPMVGEIATGILYEKLKQDDPAWTLHRLPAAEVPPSLVAYEPSLRFIVKYRIQKAQAPILYQIGDRALTVNCQRPYVGWNDFKRSIQALIDTLKNVRTLSPPTLHGLRYIDFISEQYITSEQDFQFRLEVGEYALSQGTFAVRVELEHAGCRHILQITRPTQVRFGEETDRGVLIDLDTRLAQPGSWEQVAAQLDKLHDASKSLFFQEILGESLIQRLEPEY
ncbi:MAG: TIGR04255 family protein [Bacteroidia bacterium]|nr:TIGR04255 family protein [Bacteroidia bacterium]MCX7765041.1 TIGR04255 family protein [Bacteroidia bacterium]